MFNRRFVLTALLAVSIAKFSFAAGSQAIIITPTDFDFGWAPDNAKISADFIVRNTGQELIPITSVQPTCGCTASNFSPSSLAANQEATVGLTFNTRGYAGTPFHKSAKVKADIAEGEYQVMLTGFVTNPNAKFLPAGDGIVAFDASTGKKKSVQLQNKTDKNLNVKIVQKPAAWAKASLEAEQIKAGQSILIEIAIDGSPADNRETSVTIEGDDGAGAKERATIAIRTGTPPPAYRIAPVIPSAPKTSNLPPKDAPKKPAAKPKTTDKKKK